MIACKAHRSTFTLIALVTCIASATAQQRTWTDNTGKHRTQAEFVKRKGHTVVLKKANGNTIQMPLKRLSTSDQAYINHRAIRSSLSLSNAMTEPPEWLANDPNIPFDLAKFFSAPPPGKNAAPLYLAALCEFDSALVDDVYGPEKAEQLVDRLDARGKAFYGIQELYWEFDEHPDLGPRQTPPPWP